MVKVDLKGIKKRNVKGHTYYYAWYEPGVGMGPRLRGERGSPEFIASFIEAHESRRAPDASRLRSVVVLYKASDDFTKHLADSTRRQWSPWLDRIAEHFGELRIAQFDRPEIRRVILKWRNRWADKPRTADYGMQVLSRVLSYAAKTLCVITSNPCKGIESLYSADRSDIIWTETDIAELKNPSAPHRGCAAEVAHAADLAGTTALRRGDLVRLSWSHIGEDAIELTTSKSKHQREAIIPLYDELRSVLARIPKWSTTVLTTSDGRPWTADGLSKAFERAKKAAGMADRDLRFNDLRGTAATKFYKANLSKRVVAEIMGWSEDQVDKIIWRYVDRTAATRAVIAQLNRGGSRT